MQATTGDLIYLSLQCSESENYFRTDSLALCLSWNNLWEWEEIILFEIRYECLLP